MIPRPFLMEGWLSRYKDTVKYNLGESGMPDYTVGELLERCGEAPDTLFDIVLKDHDTRGTGRLRTAIAATYGEAVTQDTVTVTTGTSEALFILFSLLLEKRRRAVVPFPSFQALYEVPRALGADLKFYNLDWNNRFFPDYEKICDLIDDSTGVVIINTPHNPSGIMFPRDAADMIIGKAAFHGAVVLADEHYRFLPLDELSPIRSLAKVEGNVAVTGSITKCFGVIGLRVGWIAASRELIKRVCDFRDYLTHNLSPVSDYLAGIVLEHRQAFVVPHIATIRENRSNLLRFAKDTPGIDLMPPEAGIVVFPRYNYPVKSNDFAMGLIRKYGVFVLPGSSFEVENHFRINLGQHPHLFREALSKIHEYCRSLGAA